MNNILEKGLKEEEDKKAQEDHLQTFTCPWEGCGRLFRAQFSLNRHMILHTQTKKYKCRFCDRTFSLPQYLREHEYTHTKELPYECGVNGCKMRFRQAGKLSLHRRTHPEFCPKKYDYSLNREKRTKTKQKLPPPENLGKEEEKNDSMFKVAKVTTTTVPGCISPDVNDDTKPVSNPSHGPGTEMPGFVLKPLPPLIMPPAILAQPPMAYQPHLVGDLKAPQAMVVADFKVPQRIHQGEGERVVPLVEYLNKFAEPYVKPVLPLPPKTNSTQRPYFCTLDLFGLIKNQEE